MLITYRSGLLKRVYSYCLPGVKGFREVHRRLWPWACVTITSDVPGCRDTVVDGVNGFLIKPRSSHALAEKMLCFLHQPELITQMGNASHQIALQQFDSSIVNSKLMKILRVDFENTKSNVC